MEIKMFPSPEQEYFTSDSFKNSLQNVAEMCKSAYEAGLTLKDIQAISGAAWADFLEPEESEKF